MFSYFNNYSNNIYDKKLDLKTITPFPKKQNSTL